MVSGCRLVVEDRRLAYRPPKWITVLRRQPGQHLGNGLHEGNGLVSLGTLVIDTEIQLGLLDLRLPADIEKRCALAVLYLRGYQDRVGNRSEKDLVLLRPQIEN